MSIKTTKRKEISYFFQCHNAICVHVSRFVDTTKSSISNLFQKFIMFYNVRCFVHFDPFFPVLVSALLSLYFNKPENNRKDDQMNQKEVSQMKNQNFPELSENKNHGNCFQSNIFFFIFIEHFYWLKNVTYKGMVRDGENCSSSICWKMVFFEFTACLWGHLNVGIT